jgi:site-specific recombinase XerD
MERPMRAPLDAAQLTTDVARTELTRPGAPPLRLSPEQFERLATLEPGSEWLANLTSPNTRRAYRQDILSFLSFLGQGTQPEVLARVTRAHVVVWRDALLAQGLAHDTVRRKLSAVSSLYADLLERGALAHNPVLGVKRPRSMNRQGTTEVLSAAEAKALLEAPPETTLKGLRDRAILAVLLFLGLRRQELCRLRVGDVCRHRGQAHLRVLGKGDQVRYVALDDATHGRIRAYLDAAGHAKELQGWLFRPVKNNSSGALAKALNAQSVYANVVRHYARQLGLEAPSGAAIGAHTLRATAATSALAHGADMAQVQLWLGHQDIATTRRYDKRGLGAGESPTFRVTYES